MNEDSSFPFEEKHKSHRGTREKIKKKRKQEKEHQKTKKIKKKEYEANKPLIKNHKKHQKSSKTMINLPKLLKILPKFLNLFADDLDNFYGIFEMLDQGESVNISGLENAKIQRKLQKIFKYLRLKKTEEGEFMKNLTIHNFNLKAKIKELVEQSFFHESSSSESSESENENEGNPLKTKENPLKTKENPMKTKENPMKTKEKHMKIKENPMKTKENPIKTKENPERTTEINETSENPDKSKKIYGVQFISPEEKALFLENSLSEPPKERETWLQEDNLSKMIDSSFNKIPKKPRDPNKHVPKYLQSLFDKEPDKIRFLAAKGEETIDQKEQEEIKDYMKKYDESHDRGKSLLEMHKDKLKEKKKGGKNERKEFNRDTDLAIIRHDSKKIFSLVNEGDNSLVNRFKNSKFERSFL